MTSLKKLSSFGAAWVLAIICAASFAFMLWASLTDSAITDEVAHIPSGYGYVHNLDYRLNPEHPPLVKALAALPLLFLNPHYPTDNTAWTTDVNGQWNVGGAFLYGSGNDANTIVRLARIGPMLLTILLIILIYLWSRQLLGEWWALLPAFLTALSPTIIAHGHYVTTDIGAAFGVVLGTYYFMKFLRRQSGKNLIYAGLAFGIAQITKFSTVLLIPFFIIITAIFWAAETMHDWDMPGLVGRFKRFAGSAWRYCKAVVIVFAIGYLVIVYPIYALFTVNYPVVKQSADTTYILRTFAGGPTPAGIRCVPMRCLANLNIWMAGNKITQPLAQYMLGVLMVLQRADGGNSSYFLGNVSHTGSRLYFPIVYLLKEPLPVLIMVLFALLLTLWGISKKLANRWPIVKSFILNYLETNFTQFSMFIFILIYWGWSMKSPLNIGLRHLIPTIPLIYMLTAGVWKRWILKVDFGKAISAIDLVKSGIFHLLRISAKYTVLVALLAWFFAETAFAAPYFLSYFNEIGGGVFGGYHFVTDSNYDWGQDLLRFTDFMKAHPEIDKVAIDYFGGGNAHYYLGDKEVDWWSAKGNPADQGIHYLVVSINSLEGQTQPISDDLQRNPVDEYHWLTALRPPMPGMGNIPTPDYRVGTTLFVYKL